VRSTCEHCPALRFVVNVGLHLLIEVKEIKRRRNRRGAINGKKGTATKTNGPRKGSGNGNSFGVGEFGSRPPPAGFEFALPAKLNLRICKTVR
jgi:hypothetical protein